MKTSQYWKLNKMSEHTLGLPGREVSKESAERADCVKTKAADSNKTDISKQQSLVDGKRAAKTLHSTAISDSSSRCCLHRKTAPFSHQNQRIADCSHKL